MKTSKQPTGPTCRGKLAACLATVSFLMFGASNALPATTTFAFNPDVASFNTNWSTANWSTTDPAVYDKTWVNGNNDDPSIAGFSFAVNRGIVLDDETIVFGAGGGINKSGAGNLTITSLTNPMSTLNLNGATINMTGGELVTFAGDTTLTGDFTFTGSGGTRNLSLNSTNPFSGTLTLTGQTSTSPVNVNSVSTASNIFLNGSSAGFRPTHASGNYNMGTMQINNGTYELGSGNSQTFTQMTHTQLSGTGGQIRSRDATALRNGSINTLIINQATNTSYSGTIRGFDTDGTNTSALTFTKQGTGNLTLAGTLQSVQNVRVEGGGLWVNSTSAATRSFGNQAGAAGSAALTIANGGTFGGNFGSTWSLAIDGNRNIVVESGGRLSPGLVDGSGNPTIGRLRISFPDGGELDLTDAVGNSGWLRFDLGANTTAGTTYDQINLTSGTLVIGSSLKFSDFNFTTPTGFDEGIYTLFSLTGSATLDGTLANTGLTGNIGSLSGTLSLDNNNIILTVIPEPRASLLLAGGLLLWVVATRRRRATC